MTEAREKTFLPSCAVYEGQIEDCSVLVAGQEAEVEILGTINHGFHHLEQEKLYPEPAQQSSDLKG